MNKYRLLFAISFIINFIVFPAISSAADITANGYTLSMVNISQSGDSLEVSGRLEYGPTCSNLKLAIRLQSDKGTHKTINCMVKDAGTGSSLFEGSSKIKKNESLTWTVEDVKTKCMGN
ncbi:hypothetical protein [Desulforegula conservatrix]|uniref:hypothetical protein n=1 Tax=Desulforegula conservatrix TaxID=153026 RepID=UPI0004083939|nr:hypothetical protein [Desulforegula conservatrix]